jgi:hypothetical protein
VDPDFKSGCPSFPVILKNRSGKPAISVDNVAVLHVAELPEQTKTILKSLPPEDAQVVRDKGLHVAPKQCNKRKWRIDAK